MLAYMGFEVLRAVNANIALDFICILILKLSLKPIINYFNYSYESRRVDLWDMTLCNPLKINRRFAYSVKE
jgi:hypothetical protein